MKKFVIIAAAGTGKRFSNNIPKQFELLSGKPVLMYPVEAFYQAIPGIHIIIVIAKDLKDYWKKLCGEYHFTIPHTLVEGGTERFHSVRNGLDLITDDGLVAVHDGARPLISHHIIQNAFLMAEKFGAVIPVVEINDSVRKVEGTMHEPMDRKKIRLVQTPQVFETSILKQAYKQQYDLAFTDDAMVVEASGKKIVLIEGGIENIKITRPHDLIVAEALLKTKNILS